MNEVHHPPQVLLTKTIVIITIVNIGPVYVAGNYYLLQEIVLGVVLVIAACVTSDVVYSPPRPALPDAAPIRLHRCHSW